MDAASHRRLELDLPCGRVPVRVFGEGRPVVFVHGFAVDGRLWDPLIPHLPPGFAYALPDLPLGCQAAPARSVAFDDIVSSLAAIPSALGSKDAVFVGNDSGGAISQLLVAKHPAAVSRLILTSCDAFGNFPPKLFWSLIPLGYWPAGLGVAVRALLTPAMQRWPMPLSWLTKRGFPAELLADWARPIRTDKAVRAQAAAVIRQARPRVLKAILDDLRAYRGEVLIAWSQDDFVMPVKDGRRLADLFPRARFVAIPDARTFSMVDNPQALGRAMGAFLTGETGIAQAA